MSGKSSLEQRLGVRIYDMVGKEQFLEKSLELVRQSYQHSGEDPSGLPDAVACAISYVVAVGLNGHDVEKFTRRFESRLEFVFRNRRENYLPPEAGSTTNQLIDTAYDLAMNDLEDYSQERKP